MATRNLLRLPGPALAALALGGASTGLAQQVSPYYPATAPGLQAPAATPPPRNPYLPAPPAVGSNPYAPQPLPTARYESGRNPYLPAPGRTAVNPFPGIKQNLTPATPEAATSPSLPDSDRAFQTGTTATAPLPDRGGNHPASITVRGAQGELRQGRIGSTLYFDGTPFRIEGWNGNGLRVRNERTHETLLLFPGTGNDQRGVYVFPAVAERQPGFSNPLTQPPVKEAPPRSTAPAYWNLNGHGR
ncbi:MAG: hypothetical protein WC708_09430 [Lentisphaeria bacterium]